MAARACCFGFLLFAASASAVSVLRGKAAQKVTPVEKVIELLKGLQKDLEEQAKAEAAAYDKYACFCKEQVDEKQYLIEKSEKKIEELDSEIKKLAADITELNDAIAELAKSIAALEAEIKEAAEERAKEHADYLVEEADMSAAISALERAIEALKASKAEMTDAKLDLAQKASRAVKGASKYLVLSQQQINAVAALDKIRQEPTIYEYHSNDIIATLDGLLKYFLEKKKELDTAEFEANSAWEKRDLDLKNTADFQSRDKAEKEKISAYKEEVKEQKEAEKAQEEADMGADASFLKVLKDECEEKATLWDQRSSTRSGELTAIASALEDLETGVATTYSANKKLVGLQASKKASKGHWVWVTDAAKNGPAPSFLQKRILSSGTGHSAAGATGAHKVIDLLTATGHKIQSSVLALAAIRVQAAEDHFVKVRGIIKDLIARLEADAESEATQKSFCDEAMTAAMTSRDDATSEIETLAAEKAKLEAEKAQLEKEIAELAAAIAELKQALIEATELRQAEQAENEKTIATAEEGEAAVTEALKVLQDFYANAFVQKGKYVPPNSDREGKTVSDRAPEIFDTTYHGDQTESKGIIGLLEVIVSDFERTISTVKTEEEIAEAAFQKFKSETEATIDEKTKSKEDKEARVTAIEDLLVTNQDNTNEQQALLDAALKQLEDLHGQCVAGEETYEDRVAKREKEIESLKEALQILIDWQG